MKMKSLYALAAAALCFSILLTGCTGTATGWVTTDDGTFYADANGEYLTGWQEIDGIRHYFDENGSMVTGWLELEGSSYYLNENGVLQTGWVSVYGQMLCFGEDGRLLTGWQERDGKRCYLGSDGTVSSGWLEDDGLTFYLDEQGCPVTGWQEIGGMHYYFQENGCMLTGWAQFGGQRYYFRENGTLQTGWTEIGEKRYCFDDTGAMRTGWIEDNGNRYYLLSDGSAAVGPAQIDGTTQYFSPQGIHVLLVNPWNSLPEDFETELSYIDTKQRIATLCYDALMQMLSDCEAAGHEPMVVSGYRTMEEQEFLFNRKINYFLDMKYSRDDARREAAKEVAVPGTSEHQLGLAVDIMDANYPYLDDNQANTAAQQWLMEHCCEYGFILRYPVGSTDITGIIYEPWHYRYVGVEMAKEIRELGVTLEEYLGAVATE